jgi:hypothetical protein
MRSFKICGIVLTCAFLASVTPTASAASVSFSGIFTTDDQMEIFSFIAGATPVTLRTWGFAGGVNANGATILAGGFDPVLSLFGPGPTLVSLTALLGFNNDGGLSVPADPGSGEHFDSFIDSTSPPIALIPGATYFLILSVSDNVPLSNNFGGGFSEQGNGNFTGALYGCGAAPFCDIDVDQRNGNWAVDIVGVTSASDVTPASGVPEPGTFGMLIAGALAVAIGGIRSRRERVGVQ